MTPRIRKAAAVATSVAVLGAAGIGVANAADTSTSAAGTTSTTGKGPGRDHRGPGGRTAETAAVAKTLGVTAAKLQAAVDAARPARGEKGKDADGRAAELAEALGVETAKVQTILDANRPARPDKGTRPANGAKPTAPADGTRPAGGRGGHGGPGRGGVRPDDTKLIAALADGLNLDEAKVKAALADVAAAHQKDHEAEETARYAAIATTLGLKAADVRSAFEAARPKKPAAATTTAP